MDGGQRERAVPHLKGMGGWERSTFCEALVGPSVEGFSQDR